MMKNFTLDEGARTTLVIDKTSPASSETVSGLKLYGVVLEIT
jgi:hypothetical protein